MRKTLFTVGVAILIALLATSAFAKNRGVQFLDLGYLEPYEYNFARSMTSDASVIAGNPSPYGGCMYWTAMDGWTLIDPDYETSDSCYVSDNGATFANRIVDEMGYEYAAKWNGMDWDALEGQPGNASCDFFYHGTFNVSGDGGTIGGLTWAGCSYARGFTWTEADGMIAREGLLDDSTRINALNWDGTINVGWTRIPWGGWQATKWVDGNPEWIQHPCSNPMQCSENSDYDNFLGEAWWVSHDGSVITGDSFQEPPSPEQPFGASTGWVQYDGGEVIGTGAFPNAWFTDQGLAFASSQDGSIVGGRFGFGPFSSATIWTPYTGLMDLNQFLINQGRTEIFDGYFMVQVNDISDDGTKLLVFGANPDGFLGNASFLIDISKVSVCHAPGGDLSKARTLMIGFESAEDHVGHGDFFGTCEAAPLARSAMTHHERFNMQAPASWNATPDHTPGYSALGAVAPPAGNGMNREITRDDTIEPRPNVNRGGSRQRTRQPVDR